MWYRSGHSEENLRTAKPWHLPFRKKRKKKFKNFADESALIEMPEPTMTPQNVVETPDLPAGVVTPPAMPVAPQPVVPPMEEAPQPQIKHKPKKTKKPDELEDLYGPDHDLKRDRVIHTPRNEKDVKDIMDETFDKPKEEEPLIEEPEIEQEPTPLEVEKEDEELEPGQEQPTTPQPVPNPPIHEFCHCEIMTMPGGRRIWRANSGACQQCLDARDQFNDWQNSIFGA